MLGPWFLSMVARSLFWRRHPLRCWTRRRLQQRLRLCSCPLLSLLGRALRAGGLTLWWFRHLGSHNELRLMRVSLSRHRLRLLLLCSHHSRRVRRRRLCFFVGQPRLLGLFVFLLTWPPLLTTLWRSLSAALVQRLLQLRRLCGVLLVGIPNQILSVSCGDFLALVCLYFELDNQRLGA